MNELERAAPVADMRYDDEDPDAVARVLVRVEYRDGRIREYEAEEPQDWHMNDPETDLAYRPMRMAVQAPGMRVPVPMTAAVPCLRLEFTAHPRRQMHIRTERTVYRGGPGDDPGQPVVQEEVSCQVTAKPGMPSPKSGSDDAGRSGALSTVSSTEHMGLPPESPA